MSEIKGRFLTQHSVWTTFNVSFRWGNVLFVLNKKTCIVFAATCFFKNWPTLCYMIATFNAITVRQKSFRVKSLGDYLSLFINELIVREFTWSAKSSVSMSFKNSPKTGRQESKRIEEDLKLKEAKESPLCIVCQLCLQCRTLQRV